MPNITDLVTITAFTAVENRIPNISNLFKRTDNNIKINETENRITTDHDQQKD